MGSKSKKILVIGDLHCGHGAGLTPPSWNDVPDKTAPAKRRQESETRSKLFSLYLDGIKRAGPFDICVVNGDAIDGKGKKSGGNEQIIPDLDDQAKCAAECIRCAKASKIVLVTGTPYHTAENGEDAEKMVRAEIPTSKYQPEIEIQRHAFLNINGLNFSIKHKVGSSSVPHGRSTALNKEKLWNTLWAEKGVNPKADILIRSHVHYFGYSGDNNCLNITTPALQGLGSKYGIEQCSGLVDWGFVSFEVFDDGSYTWEPYVPVEADAAQTVDVLEL